MYRISYILFIIPFMAFFLTVNFHSKTNAADLETQQKALALIIKTADEICDTVPIEGANNQLELSGEAKVELNKLIKTVVDIGVEGAAKYQSSEYQGVLQKDLAEILLDKTRCRLKIFDALHEKLVTPIEQGADEKTETSTTNKVTKKPNSQNYSYGEIKFGMTKDEVDSLKLKNAEWGTTEDNELFIKYDTDAFGKTYEAYNYFNEEKVRLVKLYREISGARNYEACYDKEIKSFLIQKYGKPTHEDNDFRSWTIEYFDSRRGKTIVETDMKVYELDFVSKNGITIKYRLYYRLKNNYYCYGEGDRKYCGWCQTYIYYEPQRDPWPYEYPN